MHFIDIYFDFIFLGDTSGFSLMPELFLFLSILFLFCFFIIQSETFKFNYVFTLNIGFKSSIFCIFLLVILFLNLLSVFWPSEEALFEPFSYVFKVEDFAIFLKLLLLLGTFFCLLISIKFSFYEKFVNYEYVILVLLSILGMCLFISNDDLISFYLSLELQSLCLYILASIKKNSNFSVEAGLKYFILGAISSGFLLLGFCFIYGISGLTSFSDLEAFNSYAFDSQLCDFKFGLILSLILISSGLFFKLGLFPFHLWLPDVYEGVSTKVTAFFSIVPKIAIFAVLFKLYFFLFFDFFSYWQVWLVFFAFFSIVIGSIGGLYQLRIKRLMAYSAISHVGFISLSLSIFTFDSLVSFLFYLVAYVILSITFFVAFINLRKITDFSKIKKVTDIRNFFQINPIFSLLFAFTFFSFAGIPPLLGFFSKLLVFFSLVSSSFYLIGLFSVLLSGISSFFYIRIIKNIFLHVENFWIFFIVPVFFESYIFIFFVFFNIFFFLYPEWVLFVITENLKGLFSSIFCLKLQGPLFYTSFDFFSMLTPFELGTFDDPVSEPEVTAQKFRDRMQQWALFGSVADLNRLLSVW